MYSLHSYFSGWKISAPRHVKFRFPAVCQKFSSNLFRLVFCGMKRFHGGLSGFVQINTCKANISLNSNMLSKFTFKLYPINVHVYSLLNNSRTGNVRIFERVQRIRRRSREADSEDYCLRILPSWRALLLVAFKYRILLI